VETLTLKDVCLELRRDIAESITMAMSLKSRLLQFVGRKQKIKMCCFLLSSRDVCFDIQSLEIDPIASYRDSSLRRDSTRRRA
jgi:hypothetical protein